MAKPKNRQEFIDYCLRKLGSPVIDVNVDDLQVDDRVDEAIQFWNEYHYNGSEMVYISKEITQEDLDRGYFLMPENIVDVVRVLDFNGSLAGINGGMFDVTYQYMQNNVSVLASGGLSDYVIMRSNLNMMQEVLSGKTAIRHNMRSRRLYVDTSPSKLNVGSFLVFESYIKMEDEGMWEDRWLQNYASVLIKENFGVNITKFSNMQLVGGLTFNGDKILDDAREERAKLEREVINGFSPLIRNFYG